jgi:tRNA threonylcarbamoyladenosine biosynthesis protein TsaE
MEAFVFQASSTSDTDRFAKALAACVSSRMVIGLTGTLGAGKTYLVRQVARHWGIEPSLVVSPTFTLCNEYHGDRNVYHLDLYRIADEDSLFELGATEYFESDGVCFVEWADRFPACLPNDRLVIDLDVVDESKRNIDVRASGAEAVRVLQLLVVELSSTPADASKATSCSARGGTAAEEEGA